MYCTKCGSRIPDGAMFCPSCGEPVKINVPQGNTQPEAHTTQLNDNLSYGPTTKKNHMRLIIGIICVLAVVIIGGMVAFFMHSSGGTAGNGSGNVMMWIQTHYSSGGPVFGNDEYNSWNIVSVTFLDTLKNEPSDAWDVSDAQDKSVMAWTVPSDVDNCYDLYIAGEGGVDANPYSFGLFYEYRNVRSINFNGNFYTGNMLDMGWMFKDCLSLETLDIEDWDTSKVLSLSETFAYCQSLKTLDLNNWDTSQVQTMSGIFHECCDLQTLYVSTWDTSQVEDMSEMFSDCYSLSSLDVSGWNTSNVENMSRMFYWCESLTMLDLSGWNTSKVTDMTYMFAYCDSLSYLNTMGWDLTNADVTGLLFRTPFQY